MLCERMDKRGGGFWSLLTGGLVVGCSFFRLENGQKYQSVIIKLLNYLVEMNVEFADKRVLSKQLQSP